MNGNNQVKKAVERIIEFRKEKGISLEAMAANMRISTATYYKIEKNETKLTMDRLIEIAKILEIPIAEILGIRLEKKMNSQEVGEHGVGHQYNGDIKALNNENSELSKNYIASLHKEIEFLRSIVHKKA